jgi:hypothetical protein
MGRPAYGDCGLPCGRANTLLLLPVCVCVPAPAWLAPAAWLVAAGCRLQQQARAQSDGHRRSTRLQAGATAGGGSSKILMSPQLSFLMQL